MRFLAFVGVALLGAGPLVSGRPQGASADSRRLQPLDDSMVTINPVLPAGPSSPPLDGQTDSFPIISSGNYLDSPIWTASVETDPIGVHSTAGQLWTDPSQIHRLPTDLLTAYKSPASPPTIDQSSFIPFLTGQLEIGHDKSDQPTTYHLTPGDSNVSPGSSDVVSLVSSDDPQSVDPPVLDPPLAVTEAVTTSFKNIMADKCSFGIYGDGPSNINIEVKECGHSKDLASFSEQILLSAPCIGVRKMPQQGETFSILYYEGDSNEIDLLKYSRPDFEATLRQTANSKISQKTAKNKATLLQILGLS